MLTIWLIWTYYVNQGNKDIHHIQEKKKSLLFWEKINIKEFVDWPDFKKC